MDAPSRTRFYKEVLEEQLKEPRLMIISTHLVSEMEYLFDHVLIMHQGKIMIDEPADEILERGFAVTGEKSQVEEFTKDLRVLHREALGQIQKVIIFGEKEKLKVEVLERLNIEISEVSLQDLFIHLTEKKRDVDDQRVKGGKHNG
jgi:ABC-2 type transport system ATP-binding protein